MASSTAPTVLRAMPPALTLLVPLFAVVLLVFALSGHPVLASRLGARTHRIDALTAYIAIGVLAALATLYGGLGLRTALGGSGLEMRAKGELVVEALIFLHVGALSLWLAVQHAVGVDFKAYWVTLLVIELACATLIYLVFSAVSHEFISANVPPALCLLFIASALRFLFLARRVHSAKQQPNTARVTARTDTPSFSGTRLSTIRSIEPASPRSSLSSESDHAKPPSVCSTSDLTVVNHLYAPFAARSLNIQNDVENGTGQDAVAANLSPLGLSTSRSKSILALLAASQCAALVAFVLEVVAVNVAHSATTSSGPSSVTKISNVYAILQIFRTALMVLCITMLMVAILAHAYNGRISSTSANPNPTSGGPSLPPPVHLSRMNAITVSLSTTTTPSPPLAANKRRTSIQPRASSAPDKAAKKFCIQSRFTDIALNAVHSKVVFTSTSVEDHDPSGEGVYPNKASSKGLCGHTSSASYSSSFHCRSTSTPPPTSILMSPSKPTQLTLQLGSVRDSKFDDDDGFEPGYAYIYTDTKVSMQQDPLDVGLPEPFKQESGRRSTFSLVTPPQSPLHLSLKHSHNNSAYTNEAVENSSRCQSISPPLTPTTPVGIPFPKMFSNPYPTPESTPTATSFADSSPIIPTFLSSPARSIMETPTRPTTSSSSKASLFSTASSSKQSNCSDAPSVETERHYSHSITPTLSRETTPTPRAPTPGLSFTPFIGSHTRKQDSTSSRSRPPTPSPPSSFIANLRGKAKNLSSKHDSLVQGLEGIRNGLGSSGKTKYPLRASNSHSSLGLGRTSGFRFPQLTRRASEIDKGRRNRSSLTLNSSLGGNSVEEVVEGDFMDLRDPFASPTVAEGGVLRIVSPEELNLRSGRESRSGYRDEDAFDTDKEVNPWSGSIGRSKGQRMSAWGNLPLSNSNPSSPVRPSSPSVPRTSRMKSKRTRTGDKSKLTPTKPTSKSEGCSPDLLRPQLQLELDMGCVYEEAILAQQLLMRLDESQ